jgi:phosphoenolpyruvate synthase/pyruvate phosphate dikinase
VSQMHLDAERKVFGPSPYVRATYACGPDDVREVGGKAVGLGSLLRAGQAVPRSFVVTSSAYRRYLDGRTGSGGLDGELRGLPPELADAVAHAYGVLGDGRAESPPVAVRSSAMVEDSAESSCAGQFRTFLGARGVDQVLEEVERCWMAARDPHVDSYRSARGAADADDADDAVAVVVQELVDASVAGVMFTQHPHTGDRSLLVIESSYGLGEAVVGGEVTPDLFEVNKVTREIQRRSRGSKAVEHRLDRDGRAVERRDVDPGRREEWSLDDGRVADLASMAADLESKIGRGLDMEWAIGTIRTGGSAADGATDEGAELFALQVRPITVAAGPGGSGAPAAAGGRGAPPIPRGDAIGTILGHLSGAPSSAKSPDNSSDSSANASEGGERR